MEDPLEDDLWVRWSSRTYSGVHEWRHRSIRGLFSTQDGSYPPELTDCLDDIHPESHGWAPNATITYSEHMAGVQGIIDNIRSIRQGLRHR